MVIVLVVHVDLVVFAVQAVQAVQQQKSTTSLGSALIPKQSSSYDVIGQEHS
jgi:hypothetical protein